MSRYFQGYLQMYMLTRVPKSSAETNVRHQQSELARSKESLPNKEHEYNICLGSTLLLSCWGERVTQGDNYVVKTSTGRCHLIWSSFTSTLDLSPIPEIKDFQVFYYNGLLKNITCITKVTINVFVSTPDYVMDHGKKPKKKLAAPNISLTFDRSEGSLLSDELDESTELDLDDIDTPSDNSNEFEWEGKDFFISCGDNDSIDSISTFRVD